MLRNYFLIAIAVLKRRKFFTFISLFVISFTLAVLMVLTAFIDKIINDDYPDKKRDRSLYINKLQEVGSKTGYTSSGSLSFSFLNRYAATLRTPVKVAISSLYQSTNTYVNNKKIGVNYKYTNGDYWDVMDYVFTEGGPYTKGQIERAERVAVISEDLKRDYFGDVGTVVGKYIEADNVQYRISGVVKNVPVTSYLLYSDLYLPYTVSKMDYKGKSYQGPYAAVLLANSKKDLPKMQAEYEQVMQKVPYENKDFDKLYSHADTYITGYLRSGDEKKSGYRTALTMLIVFIVFFMLLPTLNLININVTRIMERSSEIGVRKAFGASSGTLVYQFLVENIILTLLGGLIGVLLSGIIVYCFNRANLIDNLQLSLSPVVLLWGLLACFVFGLLSGVYPAWRMSRFSVITALRS
ncbi:MAG: ABC transporter permease [Williamsia sp.]|nr:ABC transporter permease [Williamsia sp.]